MYEIEEIDPQIRIMMMEEVELEILLTGTFQLRNEGLSTICNKEPSPAKKD